MKIQYICIINYNILIYFFEFINYVCRRTTVWDDNISASRVRHFGKTNFLCAK